MSQNTSKSDLTLLLEKGLDFIAEGRQAEAQECFQGVIKKATDSPDEADKPRIAQAHNQLGLMAMGSGHYSDALTHFDSSSTLQELQIPQELNRGQVLVYLGRFEEAETALIRVLEKAPGNPQATYQLGQLYLKTDRPEKALDFLDRAAKAPPPRADVMLEFGIAQEQCGNKEGAEETFNTVRKMNPDLYQQFYKSAENLKGNNFFPDALAAMIRASKILPDNPIPHHMVAIFFQDIGEKEMAEAYLKKSLALHPTPESFGQLASLYEKSNALNDAWATANTGLQFYPDDPYLHLTMARCERRAKKFDQALARLKALEGKTDDQIVTTQIDFLMGWLYDQKDNIDSAFACYSKAKKEAVNNSVNTTGDKEVILGYIRDMEKLDLSKLSEGKPPKRPGGPVEMVFLVGFPRSGTTLLNQILDSHPRLVGLEEKPTIPGPAALVQQMAEGYPKGLEAMDDDMPEKLREAYFQRIESFTDFKQDSIVIDKLPLNLIHLPLIWAMFPDAKIILALRHPMGCSLSCFMHNFRLNDAMANMFSLDDITSLYARVMGLWQHFQEVHETPVHMIKYEDVVTDIQTEAKNICTFLGIEWSEEMLNYAKHARAKGLINTPSYHQVIQPLYSDSLDRWRRYEKHLEPYKDRIGPYCETFGYSL